jgi:hypothetical protein
MEGQTYEIHMIIGLGTHPNNKVLSLPPVRTNNSCSINNVDNMLVCASRCSLTPADMFCAPEGTGLPSIVNIILPLEDKNFHAVSNCMLINFSLI